MVYIKSNKLAPHPSPQWPAQLKQAARHNIYNVLYNIIYILYNMYVLQCILYISYNAMVYTIYGDGAGDNDDDDCKMDGDDVEDIESVLQLDQKEIIQ